MDFELETAKAKKIFAGIFFRFAFSLRNFLVPHHKMHFAAFNLAKPAVQKHVCGLAFMQNAAPDAHVYPLPHGIGKGFCKIGVPKAERVDADHFVLILRLQALVVPLGGETARSVS